MICLACKQEVIQVSDMEMGICATCLQQGQEQVWGLKLTISINFRSLWHSQKEVLRRQFVNGSNVDPKMWSRNECVVEGIIDAIQTNIENRVG